MKTEAYKLRDVQKLQGGDHLCGLFHSEDDQMKSLVQYVEDGLRTNCKVTLIQADQDLFVKKLKEYLTVLTANEIDEALAKGHFVLDEPADYNFQDGLFPTSAMINYLLQKEQTALAQGYRLLCMSGEPSWAISAPEEYFNQFLRWERLLNVFSAREDCNTVLFCRYCLNKGPSAFFLKVLTTHPLALIDNTLFHNLYFIPLEEFAVCDLDAAQLKRWMSNIQERRETEEALMTAKEKAIAALNAKSQFLSTVAHEIRTPLSCVIAMAQLLQEMPLTNETKECVELINSSGDHLLTVINEVLDSARLESGKVELDIRTINLRHVIRDTLMVCQPCAMEKGVVIRSVIDVSCAPFIEGDSTRLKQIIVNLLSNAVKFNREQEDGSEKEVVLSVRPAPELDHSEEDAKLVDKYLHIFEVAPIFESYKKQENDEKIAKDKEVGREEKKRSYYQFAVRDNGIGIPEDFMKNLFGTFAQVNQPGCRNYGGSGLGLSISKQLVELMGGTMQANSVLGKGSTFTFNIPTTEHWNKGKEEEEEGKASGTCSELEGQRFRSIEVLVVDDDTLNQEAMAKMLKRLGCKFQLASHGQQAVDMMMMMAMAKESPTKFDVVLMDLQMPVCDGWQAATILRSTLQAECPPIYVLTASMLEDEEKVRARQLFEGIIAKPYSLQQLKDILHAVANRRSCRGQTDQTIRLDASQGQEIAN